MTFQAQNFIFIIFLVHLDGFFSISKKTKCIWNFQNFSGFFSSPKKSQLHRTACGAHGEVRKVHRTARKGYRTLREIHRTVREMHRAVRGLCGTLLGLHGTLRALYGTLPGLHGTLPGLHGTLPNLHHTLPRLYGTAAIFFHSKRIIKSFENFKYIQFFFKWNHFTTVNFSQSKFSLEKNHQNFSKFQINSGSLFQ